MKTINKTKYEVAVAEIALLAKNYRKERKEELWESDKIEEFGLNEFMGGKAEGFEESLDIIKKAFL